MRVSMSHHNNGAAVVLHSAIARWPGRPCRHRRPHSRTLGIQGGLAGLVLGDLVHGVLAALLALAEGLLGLGDVHLQASTVINIWPGVGPR